MHTDGTHTGTRVNATAPTIAPQFDVRLSRGQLLVGGHTVSARHEINLKQAAREQFPAQKLATDFRPLGVAPDWWAAATTDLVIALATLRAPSATLREDRLDISAIVVDTAVAEMALASLQDALPDSVDVDLRLASSRNDIDVGVVCERQFAGLDPGPVRFDESGANLLPSAYPVLDRVIALADACRDATITITGHTDSSGNETWNQRLSLARASAVAAHLATRGISPGRLSVVGAGSSVPVADNATRHGRGLNRRIDIGFSPAD
jgi:outer membrane protein OmpA-like peptidoglycan-associated protein